MSETGFKQRLVAILAADAAGYSRLMADDERATVVALDSARAAFGNRIESNQGRVIDMAGDSVLATFETAIGAVTAALDIQNDIDGLCRELPEHRRLLFRIGIHLGDVIEKDDGTVYGDGVNISARLQALAKSGGIVVSDAVQSAVRDKVKGSLVDLGEQQVKHIPHPVRAFEMHEGTTSLPATSAPTRLVYLDAPTLAVLPFANMSGDPEQDYFADGMVEEITTAVARMRWLFVIARNSSFVYKEGLSASSRLAVNLGHDMSWKAACAGPAIACASRASSSKPRAATTYGQSGSRARSRMCSTFRTESREGIVSAIEPNVRRVEIERVRVKPTSNLQAYDLVLRALPGLHARHAKSGNETKRCRSFAARWRRIPRYSLAKALGAFACMQRIARWLRRSPRTSRRACAMPRRRWRRGATIRPSLATPGSTLGTLGYRKLGFRVLGFRYDEAERAIERALALSPNLPGSAGLRGAASEHILGDGDRALEHFRACHAHQSPRSRQPVGSSQAQGDCPPCRR